MEQVFTGKGKGNPKHDKSARRKRPENRDHLEHEAGVISRAAQREKQNTYRMEHTGGELVEVEEDELTYEPKYTSSKWTETPHRLRKIRRRIQNRLARRARRINRGRYVG